MDIKVILCIKEKFNFISIISPKYRFVEIRKFIDDIV